MTIGVLALQGAVIEHIKAIQRLGEQAVAIKTVQQLEKIEGLIIPGGESTAIGKLMKLYGFVEAINGGDRYSDFGVQTLVPGNSE